MQVFELLHTDLEPLRVSDPVDTALDLMSHFQVPELPVVDYTTRKLIGMISAEMARKNPGELSGSLINTAEEIRTLDPDSHVFDASKMMVLTDSEILPVVDNARNYLGVITREKLNTTLTAMLNVHEAGSVLTIEVGYRDLTLTEIVRLTEQEGAKILGVTVNPPDQHHENFRISLKLNLLDTSRVTAALRRYGYIITQETEKPLSEEELSHRADEFLRYLNT